MEPDAPIEGRPRVLVVDDEADYRDTIRVGLEREGFSVGVASNSHEALDLFQRSTPDLVLLDLTLAGESGVELCQEMRALAAVPIIVVSARHAEAEVVLLLELGVSDYVEKPFRIRELVARIRAVLRRSQSGPALTEKVSRPSEIVIDRTRREVRVGVKMVDLSKKEFDLLSLLMAEPGRVLTREFCIDHLWWDKDLADTRTLDTHIRRLRHKIEDDPSQPRHLITVRGVGFRFEP